MTNMTHSKLVFDHVILLVSSLASRAQWQMGKTQSLMLALPCRCHPSVNGASATSETERLENFVRGHVEALWTIFSARLWPSLWRGRCEWKEPSWRRACWTHSISRLHRSEPAAVSGIRCKDQSSSFECGTGRWAQTPLGSWSFGIYLWGRTLGSRATTAQAQPQHQSVARTARTRGARARRKVCEKGSHSHLDFEKVWTSDLLPEHSLRSWAWWDKVE